jgi:hypothetical protein
MIGFLGLNGWREVVSESMGVRFSEMNKCTPGATNDDRRDLTDEEGGAQQ